MSDEKNKPLFSDNSQALVEQRDEAAVARAIQEVQAALVIGQRFPRDEVKVKAKILEACKRKELAEVAEYEYSRGGTRITGPTIDLLRAIANRWGNLRFGWHETERRNGQSSVRAFAWDVQTNGQAERTFIVRHWRDTSGGGYELTDERDIYELCANQAARRVRACLEEVIDSDIVAAAVDQCRTTMRTGEKVPLKDRAVQMLTAFAEFGVTQAMVETRIGNKLEAVSENQLASLRRVYKSLKDGVGQREDYFKPEMAAPAFAAESASDGLGPAPAPTPTATPEQLASIPHDPVSGPPPAVEKTLLRSVRELCKLGRIKEPQLLAYAGGEFASLEDMAMSSPEMLQQVHDNWASILPSIKMGVAK